MSDSKRPIIVRKKAPAHSSHHGGSWKVAYADFVTAMMAFFLVMWIMSMDSGVRELVQGYFSNPVGFKKGYGAGTNPLSMGNSYRPQDMRGLAMLTRAAQQERFESAADAIRDSLQSTAGIEHLRGMIEIVVTREGLRIELLESGATDAFFQSGSAQPTRGAVLVLNIIGRGLQRLSNPIILEGHTDARPYVVGQYSNWDLSADRANAARRLVIAAGVAPLRIAEVRGYADRRLRVEDDPFAASNRRVSLLLPYLDTDHLQGPTDPAPLSGSATD
jgi:chemotaxis protein MotB